MEQRNSASLWNREHEIVLCSEEQLELWSNSDSTVVLACLCEKNELYGTYKWRIHEMAYTKWIEHEKRLNYMKKSNRKMMTAQKLLIVHPDVVKGVLFSLRRCSCRWHECFVGFSEVLCIQCCPWEGGGLGRSTVVCSYASQWIFPGADWLWLRRGSLVSVWWGGEEVPPFLYWCWRWLSAYWQLNVHLGGRWSFMQGWTMPSVFLGC